MLLSRSFGVVLGLIVLTGCSQPTFQGHWTIERAEPAPWVEAGAAPDPTITSEYVGKSVSFGQDKIDGPALLACSKPRYAFIEVPADGLFQGALAGSEGETAKASAAATKMGFERQPVSTMTTGCEHDIAFHMRDDNTAAFALDNIIFWMARKP